MMRGFIFTLLLLVFLTPGQAIAAKAPSEGDGTLRVMRSVLNNDGDYAELCLEFDHLLASTNNKDMMPALHLEIDSQNLTAPPATISGSYLCVSGLTHGKQARLAFSDMHGDDGSRLARPYALSFIVPERTPSLVFVRNIEHTEAAREGSVKSVLQAVNINQAKIEIYRIKDRAYLGEAWQNRALSNIAPSESIAQIKDHSELIKEDVLTFKEDANNTAHVDMAEDSYWQTLPPGLYIFVATSLDASFRNDAAPTKGLKPMAATWLLRSNLDMHGWRTSQGYYVTTAVNDSNTILKNVTIRVLTQKLDLLSQSLTDENGVAFISLSADKQDKVGMVIAEDTTGNLAFMTSAETTTLPAVPDVGANHLVLDHTATSPSEDIKATVSYTTVTGPTILKIENEKGRALATLPVPNLQNGSANIVFPAPAWPGLWTVRWLTPDLTSLANASLQIIDHHQDVKIELSADRQKIGDDGDINLSIHASDITDSALAGWFGHLTVSWQREFHAPTEWRDFSFTSGSGEEASDVVVGEFLTNSDGNARVHLHLSPPTGTSIPLTARFSIAKEPGLFNCKITQLSIPLRQRSTIIGVKPMIANGQFMENSIARFNIIALDRGENPRAADNLNYHIIEEGRGFDWYQAQGRWDYKLRAQPRPIGGGPLYIAADGSTYIEWPTKSGNYRLVISNNKGDTLADIGFSASWREASHIERLKDDLSVIYTAGQDGKPPQIETDFPQPAMATVILHGVARTTVLHEARQAGHQLFPIPDRESYGPNLMIDVTLEDTVHTLYHHMLLDNLPASSPTGERVDSSPPEIVGVENPPAYPFNTSEPASFNFFMRNNDKKERDFHFQKSSDLSLLAPSNDVITLKPHYSRIIPITVSTKKTGLYTLTASVDSGDDTVTHTWPLIAWSPEPSLTTVSTTSIEPNGQASFADEKILLSPTPIGNIPEWLSEAAQDEPMSTSMLASWIDIMRQWHSVIVEFNILPEAVLNARVHQALIRLTQRQRLDGSFRALPDGDSDLRSTVDAVELLSSIDTGYSRSARDRAIPWLRQQLALPWVESDDPTPHVLALRALHRLNIKDGAAVAFIADHLREKTVSAEVAASLAVVYADYNDENALHDWTRRQEAIIRNGVADENPDFGNALYIWSRNMSAGSQDLTGVTRQWLFAKLKSDHDGRDIRFTTLRLMMALANRAGSWRVAVNQTTREQNGIVPLSSHSVSKIKNLMPYPLMASLLKSLPHKTSPIPEAEHRLYTLSGIPLAPRDRLKAGNSYVVFSRLKLPANDQDKSFEIHEETSATTSVVGCALSLLSVSTSAPWLADMKLSKTESCENLGRGMNVLIGTTPSQHIVSFAYIIHAEADTLASGVAKTHAYR